ncbi:DNA-binding GntR family transcriptional regulator [Cryobacterium sp. MP_M5]|uniref:GntR family transcriptional regulator n=1 Tax=unclassified Cryobacterium TaxID=2649013 RepID=UPI0018CA00DD|nr:MULTISPECIES: GntR family transcriptional regulator [unclassified Cryobacterium]MBG6059626.1 DNA-binding GntR family transcriptional regulator [Cryobacterium sp. MP_M3]MEC5177668.1 DNA-binding GntR family transcriptional regulator [Cryobacterium sp. MP_M5]
MTLAEILDDLRRTRASGLHAETGLWVAGVLREQIAAGRLEPGTKLPEETLGDALGVSRNTLREAFSTLSAERVVTRFPNRGVFVSRPTTDDIREIYRVRRYLEPAAVTWTPAADLGPVCLAPLGQAVERARAARDAGSIPGMAGANQDFHAGIVALAGSDRLDQLMSQVLAEMRLVFHSMAENALFHAPYVEENARIVSLLAEGRQSDAATVLADYLVRAEAQLLAAVAARAGG